MNHLVEAIRVAGVIQLVIIAVNLLLPGRLRVREQLATAPRLIRQIFYAHWAYIVLLLGLFSALCLAFPAELAGACGLGRFLSAFLATFWLSRLAVQWAYYDPRYAPRQSHVGQSLLGGGDDLKHCLCARGWTGRWSCFVLVKNVGPVL